MLCSNSPAHICKSQTSGPHAVLETRGKPVNMIALLIQFDITQMKHDETLSNPCNPATWKPSNMNDCFSISGTHVWLLRINAPKLSARVAGRERRHCWCWSRQLGTVWLIKSCCIIVFELLQYYFCTVAQEKTNWTFSKMYVYIAALLPSIDSKDWYH